MDAYNIRDAIRLLLFVVVLNHLSNLWHLWLSASDATTARETSDFPSMVGFVMREKGNNTKSMETAAKGIEDIAKGSFFSFPGFRASVEDVPIDDEPDDNGKGRSFPSLAEINQAAAVFKRGTKVFLEYVRPLEAPEREEYTLALVAKISDLRKLFGRDRPLWAGPISCSVQVSQIAKDIEIISSIVSENPAAFKYTSIHLLLSDAMMVIDWSSAWTVALKASRTDLVLVLPEPEASLMERLDDIADTVNEHYTISLKLGMTYIRIKEGSLDALLLSKRGGLLPVLKSDTKSSGSKLSGSIVDDWRKQLKNAGFAEDTMALKSLVSKGDDAHNKSKPSLLEMGSMYVVGLDGIIQGSVPIGNNLKAFTNFITPSHELDRDEVCLVTQMGFKGKMERLVKLASAWGGVMSVAIFVSLAEVEKLVRFIRNNLVIFRFCSFHLVTYTTDVGLYPINYMRNVATDAAETDFIFTVDLDFMPSLAAHDTIRSYLNHPFWGSQVRNSRAAIVIPAFEYTVSDKSDADLFGNLPLTKTELIHSDDAIPFHLNHFFAGQKPTDFERWYKTNEPYEVKFEEKYEPYVVLCSRGHSLIPRYWDGFRGYRLNKASWIKELSRAGWRFYVLPGEAFLIHMHHDISNRPMMRHGLLYKEENKFLTHLKEKYDGA